MPLRSAVPDPSNSRSARISSVLGALSSALCLTLAAGSAPAATFLVNSTSDNADATVGDGTCSTGNLITLSLNPFIIAAECTLRAAIEEANGSAGADQIEFSGFLPTTAGVVEISPTSSLPPIFSEVTVDGYSHPNYDDPDPNANPVINILGGGTPAGTHGLILLPGADDSIVRGLAISGFPSSGILISDFGVGGPENVRIQGNHLGVWRGLFYTNGNGEDGIRIENADDARIGTFCSFLTCTGKRNLISGNGRNGVSIRGTENQLGGNYIGTDRTGSATSVPFGGGTANAEYGVYIPRGSTDNTIGSVGGTIFPGGPFTPLSSAPNIISGNGISGLYIEGADNRVYGNRIGTNADGTAALPNQQDGIEIAADDTIIGGTSLRGNLISGNTRAGISVVSEDGSDPERLVIVGNSVGVNLDGDAPLGNLFGFLLQGGIDHEVTDNIVSGNLSDGIRDGSQSSVYARNFIGTNPAGDDLGNGFVGLVLLNAAPFFDEGSHLIGGAGQGNTIGFNGSGIQVVGSTFNRIVGNFIGTNANGDDLGNDSAGLLSDSDETEIGDFNGRENGLANVIGFNRFGIFSRGDNVKIQGNFIGTNAAADDLGNELSGIYIESFYRPDAVIGARLSTPDADVNGAGNTVAFNGIGIELDETWELSIRGNQLIGNDGPGIDLEGDGATANDPGDADAGSNNLQNTPVFDSAQTLFDTGTGDLQIRFAVDSPDTEARYPLTIDFYIHDPWQTPGDQASAHLGSVIYEAADAGAFVTTTITPTAGTFEENLFGDTFGGLRATATDANSNTSELSRQNIPVPEPGVRSLLSTGLAGLFFAVGMRGRVRRSTKNAQKNSGACVNSFTLAPPTS
ncbi:MAG: hypothetical protein AB8G23_01155 [Myxococcota bacterium]